MNIAFFVDGYYPTVNGVITVVSQLKNQLEKMGHNVLIITVESRKRGSRPFEQNIYRAHAIETQWKGVYIGLPNEKKIANLLRENNVQIIHAHTEFAIGTTALLVGKKLHIPCVATTHTMWEDYYKYYFKAGKFVPVKNIRKIVKNFYKHFYALINVSQKAHDYFTSPFMLPDKPSVIIPNAIDETKFRQPVSEAQKAELRKSLGISPTDKILLYTGRLVEEKRIEELYTLVADLVRKRDDTKAVFLGSGLKEEDLKKRLHEDHLEDKIIFTGFIPWIEIPKYYAFSDIFITASLSEMHSMTVLEAITMSKPIVCRKDTSFTDTIFHGENGFLADTDEEMEKYLNKLLDDDETRIKMSKKAFEISLHFSLENQVNKHLEFYQKIIDSYSNSQIK